MLNGFCRNGNPLSLPTSTESIEKEIEKRIQVYLNGNNPILFVCDSHSLSDPEINNPYPPHCFTGTEESKIIDSLKSYSNNSNTITKNTLSIIYNTGLEKILEGLKPTEIEITGVCTDICVLFAVYELKIRGYKVVVNENCVVALKSENQNFFLNYIKELLGAELKNNRKSSA